MPEDDCQIIIDRAAAAVLDATCELRAVPADVPLLHRRQLEHAIAALEGTLLDLFYARNSPWPQQSETKSRQMALL